MSEPVTEGAFYLRKYGKVVHKSQTANLCMPLKCSTLFQCFSLLVSVPLCIVYANWQIDLHKQRFQQLLSPILLSRLIIKHC